MRTLDLARRWKIGTQIGDRSGFGRVYRATADDGTRAAVKFVPKESGAARELLFVELSGIPNVIPIIDSGETKDSYVLVMPLADQSLRAHVVAAGGKLAADQAVAVLRDVAAALAAIEGRVVHRDLKPENVLLLDGQWCLADFGIARYAEAATSTDTHKFALTPAYAAPERWRFEHATIAADVYAFGVMAHEVLTGHLPFPGPRSEDFRSQHLSLSPPTVADVPAPLASMTVECMGKAPGGRPTPQNLIARLDRIFAPASPAAAALQVANQEALRERADSESRAALARSESERREVLFAVGNATLVAISDRLRELILENAPEAATSHGSGATWWALRLRDATVAMDSPQRSHPDWGGLAPAFEVIAHATIAVVIPRTPANYEGRSHSLWYCDAQETTVYRWYETGFMFNPMVPRRFVHQPKALPPGADAGKALHQGFGEFQVAYRFTPIDQGDEESFFERWIGWFARAAAGRLEPPSSMPEHGNANGSWRRG